MLSKSTLNMAFHAQFPNGFVPSNGKTEALLTNWLEKTCRSHDRVRGGDCAKAAIIAAKARMRARQGGSTRPLYVRYSDLVAALETGGAFGD